MAELTIAAKDRALAIIFGQGTIVHLFRGRQEVSDVGYRAQPLNITAPELQDGVRVIMNANPLRFGPWFEDASSIDSWAITDSVGTILARGQLEVAVSPRRGDEVVIHPGKLIVGLK